MSWKHNIYGVKNFGAGFDLTEDDKRKNVYYVIDTKPVVQHDGFYQKSLGTHTTRSEILETQNVLYEGTNAKKANEVWRRANGGKRRYEEGHDAVIYKGKLGKEGPVVIHKV